MRSCTAHEATDPSYKNLLRTVEITYTNAVLVPTLGSAADVIVTARNIETEQAEIVLRVGAERVTFAVPYTPGSDSDVNTIPVSAEWNTMAIRGLQPLRSAPIKPVDVSIAPTPIGLNITAVNHAPGSGQITIAYILSV